MANSPSLDVLDTIRDTNVGEGFSRGSLLGLDRVGY